MGGSVICDECKGKMDGARAIPENPHESTVICYLSETARVALEYCIHCPIEKIFSFKIPENDMKLFSRAAEDYFLNQLERSYKTLEFYNEVKRDF
jgi:DNA repair protein RecO (recombination protein O)